MGKFLTQGSKAVGATLTALSIIGSASIQARLCYLLMSTTGTPTTDQGIDVQLRRFTADGTGTAVTPATTASPAAAATSTSKSNYTAEPTYSTGSMYDVAFNPRATFQWAAYDQDSEIVTLVAAGAGLGAQIVAAGGSAGNLLANMTFRE